MSKALALNQMMVNWDTSLENRKFDAVPTAYSQKGSNQMNQCNLKDPFFAYLNEFSNYD